MTMYALAASVSRINSFHHESLIVNILDYISIYQYLEIREQPISSLRLEI